VGTSHAFSTPLEIRQAGQDELRFHARYETRPLDTPLYYDLRLARWHGSRGFELDLLHQKLFLTNPPPEVQAFAVSHGYNLLTLNHLWRSTALVYRLGGGLVVAHPESTVRGRTFERGYRLSGPTLNASLGFPTVGACS
jgi:hypothetical protein